MTQGLDYAIAEISGVRLCHPIVAPDERGVVKKILTAEEFRLPIKDIYYTSVYRSVVKGWHGYKTKTISFTAISGCVKFVLYDSRGKSNTYSHVFECIIGVDNYTRIIVPPGVFSAFKGIAEFSGIVVAADESFNELGMIRLPIEDIEYDWRTKNG